MTVAQEIDEANNRAMWMEEIFGSKSKIELGEMLAEVSAHAFIDLDDDKFIELYVDAVRRMWVHKILRQKRLN